MKDQKKPKSSPTKAELRRKILELNAQLVHVYHFADIALDKTLDVTASGVLVQLSALGGMELVLPFVIKDGLSPETVECLRKDIRRSYEQATVFKPTKT